MWRTDFMLGSIKFSVGDHCGGKNHDTPRTHHHDRFISNGKINAP